MLVVWITVFILAIYDKEEVYIGSGTPAEEGKPETNYKSLTKLEYIALFASPHLINLVFFTVLYVSALSCKNAKWGLGRFSD